MTTEHHLGCDHPERPPVGLARDEGFVAVEGLGWFVSGGSFGLPEDNGARLHVVDEPEVAEHQIEWREAPDEDVFRFQIPVDQVEVFAVHVCQRCSELTDGLRRVDFAEMAPE